MNKYNTVIFDLDGTLLDTLQDLMNATNYALCKHNYPTRTYEEVRAFVGNGVAKLIERAVPEKTSPLDTAATLATFKDYYSQHLRDNTAPYAGIYDLLNLLQEKNYKMAIVSNKLQPAVTALAEEYFSGYFKVAIGESAKIHKKPAPDMVYEALRQLDSSQEKAVYIGDSEVDLATAQNAGLLPINVLWGFRTKDFLLSHGGTTLVSEPREILDILEGENS